MRIWLCLRSVSSTVESSSREVSLEIAVALSDVRSKEGIAAVSTFSKRLLPEVRLVLGASRRAPPERQVRRQRPMGRK